jgi:hypothetical protein
LSPVPLAAVSAYFNSDSKVTGTRARLFNALDGVTTLAAAIVPFAGPSFKIGNAVFTAGFVPGLHKYVGDLSDQQLQTLTGQSWQSSETVAANGGYIDKFAYIQKNEQFADQPVEYSTSSDQDQKQADAGSGTSPSGTAPSQSGTAEQRKNRSRSYKYEKQTMKKLTNLIGLEVTGFEVQEATAGTATPATPQPVKSNTSASPSTSASGAGAAPAVAPPAAAAAPVPAPKKKP